MYLSTTQEGELFSLRVRCDFQLCMFRCDYQLCTVRCDFQLCMVRCDFVCVHVLSSLVPRPSPASTSSHAHKC